MAATRPAATVEAMAAPSPVTAVAMTAPVVAAAVGAVAVTTPVRAMCGTGGDGGDGSGGGGLKEPKQGSFDKTIKEYDDAIAKAQKDFQELQGKFESVLASKFDIHLGTGGGSLPCWDFTALGQRYDVCLTQYAQELSVIRYVVLFIAAILAGWIVFYRS
ncbi:coat protein [Pseudomonas aeruginosa]|uniref:coat protein n=1 Tax=Pseudomonas aeruginosa TaxID=287 RepID=UPI0021B1268F|nr:coat protein [Pseudomonas aeruginosa]